MAYRKINNTKKYQGIFEYYNANDKAKVTRGYYLRYRNELGDSCMVNLKADTKEDAFDKANVIRNEVEQQRRVFKSDAELMERTIKNKKLSLNQLADIFFDNRTAKNNDKDTRIYINRISPHLGEVSLARITTQHIKDLPLSKYAPKTQNMTIDLLRLMLNFAIQNKMMTGNNPITRELIPKEKVSTQVGRVLNDVELELLFSTLYASNNRLYLFCKILYFTGVRPDAVLSLQVKHHNPQTRTLLFKAMKLSNDFEQPLREEVEILLIEWIKSNQLEYEDYLFYPTVDGIADKTRPTPYEAIRKGARTIFDKLFNVGIPSHAKMRRASFYSLRRTSATKIYNAHGLVHASKFLHHSDVKTTMKYLNIDGDIKGAIDAL